MAPGSKLDLSINAIQCSLHSFPPDAATVSNFVILDVQHTKYRSSPIEQEAFPAHERHNVAVATLSIISDCPSTITGRATKILLDGKGSPLFAAG